MIIPQGKESMAASALEVTSPPTVAPSHQVVALQNGYANTRLMTKTNCSGADIQGIKSKRIKDKIRDLRLRFQQTGSTSRARASAQVRSKPASASNNSQVLTDDQALHQ